jgi:hypothetical protein
MRRALTIGFVSVVRVFFEHADSAWADTQGSARRDQPFIDG